MRLVHRIALAVLVIVVCVGCGAMRWEINGLRADVAACHP